MKLRLRLQLILGVAFALLLLVGTLSIHSLTTLGERFREIEARHEGWIALDLLRDQVLRTTRTLTDHLSGQPGGRARYEQQRQELERAMQNVLAGPERDLEAHLVARLRHAVTSSDRAAERALFLAKRGEDERAFARMRAWIVAEQIPDLDRVVQDLREEKRRQVRESQEVLVEHSRRTTASTYLAGAVLVLLAALSLLLVHRWLVRPMAVLSAATRRIAGGAFGESIPLDSHHELGPLARDIEAMAVSLRESQEQLVEKERLAAVGELTGAVAHNLRNPLASIRVLAQNVLRTDLADERLTEPMRGIMEIVDRSDRWLKDLLMVSRPLKLDRQVLDLGEVLTEVAAATEPFARRRGVRIELQLDPACPGYPVDRRRLDQALLSLVNNAVEASTTGSVVTLHAGYHADRRELELRVEDQGEGMTPEVQAKVFTPYFSTKKSGMGLGLALTRRIILSHDGDIKADSAPGKGCRMVLTFPVPPEENPHG